jgi:hypothetical protein
MIVKGFRSINKCMYWSYVDPIVVCFNGTISWFEYTEHKIVNKRS